MCLLTGQQGIRSFRTTTSMVPRGWNRPLLNFQVMLLIWWHSISKLKRKFYLLLHDIRFRLRTMKMNYFIGLTTYNRIFLRCKSILKKLTIACTHLNFVLDEKHKVHRYLLGLQQHMKNHFAITDTTSMEKCHLTLYRKQGRPLTLLSALCSQYIGTLQ